VNSAFERLAGVGNGSAVGKHVCESFRYSDENNDFCMHLGECIEAAAEGLTTSRATIMKRGSAAVFRSR